MKEYKKVFMAIAITLICICGVIFMVLEKIQVEEQGVINYNDTNDIPKIATEEEGAIEQIETIFIQLTGAINQPGVYEVSEGTRVFELIELAGGLKETADKVVVNQAREVEDEENIYFPTKDEVISGDYQSESGNGLININKASVSELQGLTGIGEAKAKSIITYRDTNGDYENIEDIMNVPGIKESVFQLIKDLITT